MVSQTSPQNWGDPILTETSTQNYVNLFIESVYADNYGRYQKCYELTRDGFSLLVMGFTGKKALEWKLKYIKAFNLMEQELTNRTANIEEVMVRAVTLSVTETVKALIPLIKPSAPKAEGEQKRIIKKNRRTMPSKISTLAPELKQKVDDMIVSGDYSCQQIANFIMNNSDISISQMAVNKYKRRNFIYEVLLDEVALMPRSFVEQALARCSVTGSKFWFNCNPDSSEHWFFKEWIQKSDEKNTLHLHFTMDDNLSLSDEVKNRYERTYTGVFYDRYIRGLWVLAEGLVYGNVFDKSRHVIKNYAETTNTYYYISVDYGTLNPCSMGLWALENDKAVRIREYYYDGRRKSIQKTDEEYYAELEKLADGYNIKHVIVDPSAASFITTIKKHGKFRVRRANNSVIDGIRNTMTLLKNDRIFICDCCEDIIREFALYRWDEKSGKDAVIKENDHAMDDLRYFVNTAMGHILEDVYRKGGAE